MEAMDPSGFRLPIVLFEKLVHLEGSLQLYLEWSWVMSGSRSGVSFQWTFAKTHWKLQPLRKVMFNRSGVYYNLLPILLSHLRYGFKFSSTSRSFPIMFLLLRAFNSRFDLTTTKFPHVSFCLYGTSSITTLFAKFLFSSPLQRLFVSSAHLRSSFSIAILLWAYRALKPNMKEF